MPAPPAGKIETGAPSFIVLGGESLGLSSAPSDLHVLPDGRILVVSEREIAIGDGVRWETFQEAPDKAEFIVSQVAVDSDGRIYAGLNGSIARIEIGGDSRWRFVPVVPVPTTDPYAHVAQFADTWLWQSGGGSVIAWRPGQEIRSAALSVAVEHIFAAGDGWYASNTPSGAIYRLKFGGNARLVSPPGTLAADTVTCSASYGDGRVMVGTVGDGLRIFDAGSLAGIPAPRILGQGSRINDLCRIDGDLYAAAVDSVGIVIFRRGGAIVQVLNGALDQRIIRARRLVYSANGVLWGLLDNAVVGVQIPSPASNFEPLLASVMNFARPLRHRGGLWVLADGRLTRGVYTADGLLDHFEPDAPPGRFLWAAAEVGSRLIVSNESGIFAREGDADAWREMASGIVNARVGIGPAAPGGGMFYVARDEIGWIREAAGTYSVRRIPVDGLGEVYNAVDDPSGAVWLELGTNRVGRVDFAPDGPSVRFFGKMDGLGDGWTSIFALDGAARFSNSRQLQRYDTVTGRFVDDGALARRIPALATSTGRPARDASGRLWFASRGAVHFVDDLKDGANAQVGTVPLGFEPTEFNMESDGIVWMQGPGHLVRYDPAAPPVPSAPLRALITSVQLASNNRHFVVGDTNLPPLRYTENSLMLRFAAPSNPFGPPVTFDVMIEGAGDRWVSTGTVGSASYNRLKEGRYVFRVRPVRSGIAGSEARLVFTVLPPWYRTRLAWAAYGIAAALVAVFGASIVSFLQRRETTRLGRLVAERTAALAASEERYRGLNADLEARVSLRTTELSKANADLKREIAEHRLAEERIGRLNRTLALLSEINQAIVRERDLPALHSKACRIAVEKGGFRLAWIGLLNAGTARLGFLAQAGGTAGFVESLNIDLGDGAAAAGPTCAALRRGAHAICNDLEGDLPGEPWRDAALSLGYRSSGVFPLTVRGRTVGVAGLYSGERGFFDAEELTLIDELAMDLSFALEHSEAESGRRKAEELFRQAQKMEAIGQLAGGVAHDFNNLLTVIQGHCGLLLADAGEEDAGIRESAKEIQAAAVRAANLTRQLLTFSRRQPMHVRPIELDEVVSSVSRMLQRLIGEDIVLHTRLLPGGAWVAGDPGMIEQVLLNLAVNARDAISGGGELWIGLDAVAFDEAGARRHPAARPGSFVQLSLRDTGTGIAAENLPHIFEPFFTTKAIGKGTGLGLATVHGIIEQHRGWIEVESEAGRGTTFRVYLPRLARDASPASESGRAPPARGGRESILVAEDEDAVRDLVVKILGGKGYNVLAAPSGQAAIDLWRRHAGAFDLLLTDLIMPGGMSGAQLAERLRAEKPGLRVITMSGYRGATAVEAPGPGFLQKPFDPARLATAVRTCLDTG